jgi:hypothetical protein
VVILSIISLDGRASPLTLLGWMDWRASGVLGSDEVIGQIVIDAVAE